MSLAPKLVVVTRKSALEELVIRFGTRDRARFYITQSMKQPIQPTSQPAQR